MLTRIKNLRNRRRFAHARTRAERADDMVCATITRDGTPEYFVMSRTASDAEVRAAAFERREGRPMSRLERQLLDLAEGTPHGSDT